MASAESNGPEDPPLRGDGASADDFFDAVYRELRGAAAGALRRQRVDHTLQPTALVHEVWLKLSASASEAARSPASRGHFLATATRAMRQVLQDHARARSADKRGVREAGVDPSALVIDTGDGEIDAVALEEALQTLGGLNERHGRVAELRILGGLNMPEVAEEVGVSLRTVESDWRFARAWLRSELGA